MGRAFDNRGIVPFYANQDEFNCTIFIQTENINTKLSSLVNF